MQRRILMVALAGAVLLGAERGIRAQTGRGPFTPEELDQMLAPIALYPDALLSQVLMAATYPLEVVEAARWSRLNPGLKGDAAVAAVGDKDWDISVKSLTAFPQVLAQMDSHLDWTQKIGDAMLAQEGDVGDSIQRLRARAADAGNLSNNSQQRIEYLGSGAERTIVIVPADPTVVYVPYYDPIWAYGPWPYPAYPPYYYPPLPGYGYGAILVRGFMFGIGLLAARAIFGGWHWGRGASYVNINVNRAVYIDRNFTVARTSNGAWRHDPDHRRGVAYRDLSTQQRFGQTRPGADQRQQYRGRESGPSPGVQTGQGPQVGTRPNLPQQGTVQRPGSGAPQANPPANVRPNAPQQGSLQRPGSGAPQANPPANVRPNAPQQGSLQHPGSGAPQAAPPTNVRPNVPQQGTFPRQGTAPSSPSVQSRPTITPSAPRGGAISGVDRGGQVNRESVRGNAQQQRSNVGGQQPRAGGGSPPRPAGAGGGKR